MLLHCIGIEAMQIFNGMKFGESEDPNKMADILVKYDQHFLGQKKNSSSASNLIAEIKNLVSLLMSISVYYTTWPKPVDSANSSQHTILH